MSCPPAPDPSGFHRIAIIGDVHGCLSELERLVARLRVEALDARDPLVFVGDLVDKGPNSAGVVRFVQGLREQGQPVVLVLGNHDERHADWRRAVAEATRKGIPIRKQDSDGKYAALHRALTPAEIAFLDSAVPWYSIPWADALVVHGGILPGMLPDPSRLPDPSSLADLGRKERDRAQRVTRLRWWRPSGGDRGSFVPMGSEQSGDRYWAEVYDGRFGRVYFGHEPFPAAAGPVLFPHATALDLGLVHGGRLAAVVVERGREPRCMVEPARQAYAPLEERALAVAFDALPVLEPGPTSGGRHLWSAP